MLARPTHSQREAKGNLLAHSASHLFCRVESDLANCRDEVHLDEGHRPSEALLEPDEVDLGVSEISLTRESERGVNLETYRRIKRE